VVQPLHASGVDSLLAVKLRNWFGNELYSVIAMSDNKGAEIITSISIIMADELLCMQ